MRNAQAQQTRAVGGCSAGCWMLNTPGKVLFHELHHRLESNQLQ
jgi:hypothetical protein